MELVVNKLEIIFMINFGVSKIWEDHSAGIKEIEIIFMTNFVAKIKIFAT